MMTIHDIIKHARLAKWGTSVIDRVWRLNQGYKHGDMIRGRVPAQTLWRVKMRRDVVGKGEFIKRYGRIAWDGTPSCYKSKNGKRSYIGRDAVEDNVWMRP